MSVQFFFIISGVSLSDRKKLKAFIEFIFKNEGKKLLSLTYVFCPDEYLLGINNDFLRHNFYTDIITFDLSSLSQRIEGEIYISMDRVRENAKVLGLTMKSELHRVIFHGALHLCGYKDKTRNEQALMRSKEDRYLELYFR